MTVTVKDKKPLIVPLYCGVSVSEGVPCCTIASRLLLTSFVWQHARVQKVIRRIVDLAGGGLVIPTRTLQAVAADPDDNRIIECAVEGNADAGPWG